MRPRYRHKYPQVLPARPQVLQHLELLLVPVDAQGAQPPGLQLDDATWGGAGQSAKQVRGAGGETDTLHAEKGW